MKTLLAILAICCGCVICPCEAKATGCHVQEVRRVEVRTYAAPIVEYQVVSPHYDYVQVERIEVNDHHGHHAQRVRVIQKNQVRRPIVVRERNIKVEKVQKSRSFSRQRSVESY